MSRVAQPMALDKMVMQLDHFPWPLGMWPARA